MENTKAKNIIIAVIIILLVAVICFGMYYIIRINTSREQPTVNKKIFNIIGQTIGAAKGKYVSSGKVEKEWMVFYA